MSKVIKAQDHIEFTWTPTVSWTPPKTKEDGATKHDTDKPQLSLLPLEGLTITAEAMAHGAAKYGRDNYKKGFNYSRLLDATLRHVNQFSAGEDMDTDSGKSHIGHAIASLMMLAYMLEHRVDLDDRTPTPQPK